MTRSNMVAVATVQQPPRDIVFHGDCLDVLRTLPDCSVDAVVTDPPAGISFMGKDWDGDKGGRRSWIAWLSDVMHECMRVVKPGGHALVWALPRTSHWTACALEDAGWEIRDCLYHIFGSGFPKSLDVSKAIDKLNGRYLSERVKLAKHIRECRLKKGYSLAEVNSWFGYTSGAQHWEATHPDGNRVPSLDDWYILQKWLDVDLTDDFLWLVQRMEAEREVIGHNDRPQGWFTSQDGHDITAPATDAAREWDGWGTALKPAVECWWLCRKPLAAGNVAANVLAYGTGAINVDACRVAGMSTITAHRAQNSYMSGNIGAEQERGDPYITGSTAGRWPANLLLSHTPDCTQGACVPWCPAAVLDGQSGERKSPPSYQRNNPVRNDGKVYGVYADRDMQHGYGDTGGASRYFAQFYYSAKASRAERGDFNTHPTVKSLSLMRWLCRLITPSGGTVLDPFGGSGSTAVAAVAEAFGYVLIERDADYVEIIRRRVAHAEATAKTPQPQPRKPARKKPQPQRITPIAATVATVEQSSLWRMEA